MSSRLWAMAILLTAFVQLSAQQSNAGQDKSSSVPKGTADTAKSIIDKHAGQLNKADKLKQTPAKILGPTFSDRQILRKSDGSVIEFPMSWREISASRAKIAGHRLTDKEAALLKALDTTLKVDFDKTPFQEVLKFLSEKTKQAIVVPEVTLEEAEVGYDSQVTLKLAKPVPMHSILRRILRERGLTYVVKDETIQVVTPERAREMMVVRVHQVMDLCGLPRRRETLYKAMILKGIIEKMIEPEIWDVNGGSATISYNNDLVTMTIRAPAELHLRMGTVAYGPAGK